MGENRFQTTVSAQGIQGIGSKGIGSRPRISRICINSEFRAEMRRRNELQTWSGTSYPRAEMRRRNELQTWSGTSYPWSGTSYRNASAE